MHFLIIVCPEWETESKIIGLKEGISVFCFLILWQAISFSSIRTEALVLICFKEKDLIIGLESTSASE